MLTIDPGQANLDLCSNGQYLTSLGGYNRQTAKDIQVSYIGMNFSSLQGTELGVCSAIEAPDVARLGISGT